MMQLTVCLICCGGLLYIFWYDLKLWWYTPWCSPCQRYTRYIQEQVLDDYHWLPMEDRYTQPGHYQCLTCGRCCEVEDAFNLKENMR